MNDSSIPILILLFLICLVLMAVLDDYYSDNNDVADYFSDNSVGKVNDFISLCRSVTPYYDYELVSYLEGDNNIFCLYYSKAFNNSMYVIVGLGDVRK